MGKRYPPLSAREIPWGGRQIAGLKVSVSNNPRIGAMSLLALVGPFARIHVVQFRRFQRLLNLQMAPGATLLRDGLLFLRAGEGISQSLKPIMPGDRSMKG